MEVQGRGTLAVGQEVCIQMAEAGEVILGAERAFKTDAGVKGRFQTLAQFRTCPRVHLAP